MTSFRRRRCVVCHHGFTADPRVGEKQKVCSLPQCQKIRRQRTQADWRKRHSGYAIAWRAKWREACSTSDVIEIPRMPPPLSALPWDLAQQEFGGIGADFIASFGRKVLEYAKDEILKQLSGITGQIEKEASGHAKDQRRSQERVFVDETPQVDGSFSSP